MTRTSFGPVLTAICAVALVTAATAAGRPNPNRGKSLFRANCKTCHMKGGEARDLSPLTKTQAQWNRAFGKTVAAMLPRVEAKTGVTLGPEQLADVQFFLVSHAADSDRPETCGIK